MTQKRNKYAGRLVVGILVIAGLYWFLAIVGVGWGYYVVAAAFSILGLSGVIATRRDKLHASPAADAIEQEPEPAREPANISGPTVEDAPEAIAIPPKTIDDFIEIVHIDDVYSVFLRNDCPDYEYMRINMPYSGVVKKGEAVLYISVYSFRVVQLRPPAIFIAPLDGVATPCVGHDGGKVTEITDSKILYFNTDTEYVEKIRAKTEARHSNNRIESEKREIAKRLKEKEGRRQLEKQVRQELIDAGELIPAAGREPIPRDIVDAVYTRDGGRCVYCGSTEKLQIDHIIPFSKGGADAVENFQILCQKCNLKKSNKIG